MSSSDSTSSNTGDSTLPPEGASLQQALKSLVAVLNEQWVNYAIIGGLALMQYGRVRTTVDVDALMLVPQLKLPAVLV